ncbi:glycerol-3-phosphate ABC transporter permease [Longispora fulva]|uniref:sn-glycerol 3-phosphate transport system permease protein n=1 Tax=Longispora fulva TaxID=619741 RepID=A0A8J7GY76_9ACTN|nr:carbohydrate ABC transporter permease [Longispora fulva]MBG6140341.1 sn-glycerol 3-phosphate transport system permease protein [Longispora fulva]GIG57278.1 glycerol-3-phosphate ABC transporter permease [Longispora fulva]
MRKLPVYLVLGLAATTVLFPVYYAFAGSVMVPGDLSPPALFPRNGIRPGNFGEVLSAVPLARQYANSAIQAGLITVSQLFTSVLAAYAFVYLRLPRFVFWGFLATLMVPVESIIIPNYLRISDWGLARGPGTYLGLVLPFLASAFGTFLLRQSFRQFPAELRDAAAMDGAGHLRFLFRILVPLSKPAIAAVGVYVFLTAWNQFLWPLLLVRDPSYQTLQIGVSQLNDAEAASPGLILAGVVLSLLPTLAIVIFGQRHIVRGLTAGAVQ